MKGNLAGKTWNQPIVNKFSFTLGQQSTLLLIYIILNSSTGL